MKPRVVVQVTSKNAENNGSFWIQSFGGDTGESHCQECGKKEAGNKQQAMPPSPASLTQPTFAAAHRHTHVDQCSGSASLP